MKILITGGTTFVSRYTAEFFINEGHEVYVMNRGSRTQPEGAKLIKCDRLDCGDLLRNKHFDAVLDITAYTPEHIKGLLDSGASFDTYILVSSSAVYPETNPQPFSEEQNCGKNSIWGDYGINKLNAENYLRERVPRAYIIRPPYFYGKYDNLYREAFVFDCAAENRPFYIPGNGDMKLHFFNVEDFCRFIRIILSEKPERTIFNVGNPDTVTIREWVTMCYNAAGKEPTFVSVDKSVFQRNYFCFYDYEYVLDVSAQNELMPDTIPLYDGLKAEFEWYKDNTDSIYRRNPYIEFIQNNL